MQSHTYERAARTLILSWIALWLTSIPMVGQSQRATSSYYYQAYDAGFRAGQADYNARRSSNYQAALVTTAGLAAISKDYRSAFKLGYQDGYSGYGRGWGNDWSYKHHHHDADCDEDDSRGEHDFSCRQHHDNGKHKGWYKKHHHGSDDQGEDEQSDDQHLTQRDVRGIDP